MGGSQSTERVSISRDREDEAFNIVRVSEDAIRTLRGERTGNGVPVAAGVIITPPPESGKAIVGGSVVIDEKTQAALNDERLLTQRLRQDFAQSQQNMQELQKKLAALERDAKEATLSAVVGGADKIKQAELYYRQKLDELLERERRRQEESAAKFKESLERLQQRFLKYSCHKACAEVESKVLQCYLQNPNEPLRCAREGDEFVQCVDEYRAKLLTAKDMTVSAN